MMLSQISVQGFKTLQDVQHLDLGQVNVFIGANGSGKSNLLEAVGLLGAAIGGFLDDQTLLRRGVRLDTPALFMSSFKNEGVSKQINIRATWSVEQGQVECHARLPYRTHERQEFWLYNLAFELDGEEVDWSPLSLPQGPEIAREMFGALSDYAIFAPNTPTLRGTILDAMQRPPVGLAGGQLAEAVGELLDVERGKFGALDLDELLERLDWVDRIAIGPPTREIVSPSVPTMRSIIRFSDRWMVKAGNQLSAYDASEGALYVLFALVLALHPQSPRLLAVENMDHAMHPRLLRSTVRLFCRHVLQATPKRQVLLTTHNPIFLDGLDLDDDRMRLFTVERTARGVTRVSRVQAPDETTQAGEDELPLSIQWVLGRLGGVPDIF
jgi:energy-coupling factor transporter ATP-binding protein EcfA2